jgi:hypothetical protein
MLEIIGDVSHKMRIANNEVFKPNRIELSTKNLSEILGKITESSSAEILSKRLRLTVNNARSDAAADLTFEETGEKFEIKVSSTDSGWQGGEFSDRPYDYIFISWGGDFDEFFVARALLTKKSWHSNIKKRRYGTTYYAKDLYKNRTREIFLGKLYITPRGAIRVRREKIR